MSIFNQIIFISELKRVQVEVERAKKKADRFSALCEAAKAADKEISDLINAKRRARDRAARLAES